MNTKGIYRKISVENKIKISRRQNTLRSGFSSHRNFKCKMMLPGTSLVVQWLRICLLMQKMQVRFLVGKLRSHMPWGNEAHAASTEPMPQLERSPCNTACVPQLRPDAAKWKKKKDDASRNLEPIPLAWISGNGCLSSSQANYQLWDLKPSSFLLLKTGTAIPAT